MTYEPMRRSLRDFVVKDATLRGGTVDVSSSDGWHFGFPLDRLARPVEVGGSYQLETVRFSFVVGCRDAAGWLYRLTDDEIRQQDQDRSDAYERDKRERYERNRGEWAQREEHLPTWAQQRLHRFRTAAGAEKFGLEGWGYELLVCELAAAYAVDDEARAEQLCRDEGASGNQDDCARALARLVKEGREHDAAHGVPAALSPLTGSADYS